MMPVFSVHVEQISLSLSPSPCRSPGISFSQTRRKNPGAKSVMVETAVDEPCFPWRFVALRVQQERGGHDARVSLPTLCRSHLTNLRHQLQPQGIRMSFTDTILMECSFM